jgi:hypothetical protein
MRRLAFALLVVMVFGGDAAADERYDRRLDEAAASIVASRMDHPLRGAFGLGEEPHLERRAEEAMSSRPQGRRPGVWQGGLAIAVEKRPRASPEL